MIKNFILVHYEKKITTKLERYIESKFSIYRKRAIVQKKFINYAIKQIRHFYKNANIHVICKDKNHPILQKNKKEIILHEFTDMQCNHIDKFKIFGLLNEPSMYFDLDILLVKPFEEHHLETKNPFNVFRDYKGAEEFRPNGLNKNVDFNVYNNGIVWINEPSKDLENEFISINQKHFSNENEWLKNDEFAVSKFINDNKLKMNLCWDVGHYRLKDQYGVLPKIDINEMKKYQSIHYSIAKEAFMCEYSLLWAEKYINI